MFHILRLMQYVRKKVHSADFGALVSFVAEHSPTVSQKTNRGKSKLTAKTELNSPQIRERSTGRKEWNGRSGPGYEYEACYHLDPFMLLQLHPGKFVNILFLRDTRAAPSMNKSPNTYVNRQKMQSVHTLRSQREF
jgi:hypothetical protein